MDTNTQNLCEKQDELTDELYPKRKKLGVFLLKTTLCFLLVAFFILFVYLLIYSFENDGADWLRKNA